MDTFHVSRNGLRLKCLNLKWDLMYTNAKSRTALGMDGTPHTDLAGFENIRDIKKVLYDHFNNLKSQVDS